MATPSSSDALVVTSGPLVGQILPLERRELVIGRDASCDLPLTTHAQLSRRHAKMVPSAKGWTIEDLGSTNGTWVDGARVERAELRHGARLKMGDFEALARVYGALPQSAPQAQSAPQPTMPSGQGAGSPAVMPQTRKAPKWIWPAFGVGAFLLVAGLALGGRGSSPRADSNTQAKVRRAIEGDGARKNPTNGEGATTTGANGKNADGNVDALQTDLAPPVNGRIAPATVSLAEKATVLIIRPAGKNAQGEEMLSFGSGFVSGNGHQVVTNRHVVANENGEVGDCLLVFEAGTKNENRVTVSASNIELASGTEQFSSDLALLSLPDDAPVPASLPLGQSELVSETDTLWVFGFPLGVGTLTLDQEVPSVSVKAASVERIQRGQVDGQDAAKVLQLGSTVTHGNSGGPVLNAKGEVVGVISQGDEGTGISYAIPTVWVKRLVR